jgi:catechol 2,3-dioxygenase-like lactoylglutathione lyase family enzyme
MFSHVTVGAEDVALMGRFYDAFFIPLGIVRFFEDEAGRFIGWRRDIGSGHFFIGVPFNGHPASAGNGCMCAFSAPSQEAVRLAWQAALAHGGTDEGPPGPRPHYAPDYFGAYVRDPEGNKMHVVHRDR